MPMLSTVSSCHWSNENEPCLYELYIIDTNVHHSSPFHHSIVQKLFDIMHVFMHSLPNPHATLHTLVYRGGHHVWHLVVSMRQQSVWLEIMLAHGCVSVYPVTFKSVGTVNMS